MGFSALWALASGFLLATAGVAHDNDPTPRIAYAEIKADDQLTAAGTLVQPERDARYAAALQRERQRVATTQNYLPTPAIWKISDGDTTIYLFGTVHSLPPGFRWRNPVLEGIIVRADSLLLESTEADDDGVTFLEGVQTEDGKPLPPLIERTTHRVRGKLAELQAGLTPEAIAALDKMPTWVAAMSIGSFRDMMIGDIPSQGADDWLEKHFRATGRPVEAIENAKQVITNLNGIPERAQRLMLEAALLAPDRTHEQMDSTAHAWARGNVGPDSPLRIMPEDLDPSQAMADPLLAQRNAAWVISLTDLLAKRKGTILFAAGAGHFVGPGSVIDLLQKRGVRVERVQ